MAVAEGSVKLDDGVAWVLDEADAGTDETLTYAGVLTGGCEVPVAEKTLAV